MKKCPLFVTFLCREKSLVVFVYKVDTVSSHLLGIHSYKPQSFFKIVKKGMDSAVGWCSVGKNDAPKRSGARCPDLVARLESQSETW
jgi:hypothetical protein